MITQEQKRIRIAEACGWKFVYSAEVAKRASMSSWYFRELPVNHRYSPLPDYLNDLNAIHAAEQTLNTLRSQEHGKRLQETARLHCIGIVPDYERDLVSLSWLMRMPADKRAEAFGLALGLWKEGE